jgi:hypothetical protein
MAGEIAPKLPTRTLSNLQVNLANGVTGQLPYANTTGIAASGANGDITSLTGLTGEIKAPTQITDTNGNKILTFTAIASAVNYLDLQNNVTVGSPVFQAKGSDTNINLQFNPKNAGICTFYSTNPSPFFMGSGTGYQHGTYFVFPNTAAARTVTFPDADGTIVFGTAGTFTPTVTLVGGVGNTVPVYSTNTGRYQIAGNRVFCEVLLTGDGGAEGAGTGQINIALPFTASASNPTFAFPCGVALNSATYALLTGLIAGGASTIALNYFNTITTHVTYNGVNQNNTSRYIRLNFWYEI